MDDASTLLSHLLQSISSDGLQLLVYVAVGDRSMTVDELSDLTDWEGPRLSRAIAEVARSGLFAEVMGVVRVTHQLLAEAVLGFVTPEQVRRAHRRIATLLEANAGEEGRLGLRALEHRLAGGLPVEATALALAASPVSRDLGLTGIRRLFDIAGDAVFANVHLAEASGGPRCGGRGPSAGLRPLVTLGDPKREPQCGGSLPGGVGGGACP